YTRSLPRSSLGASFQPDTHSEILMKLLTFHTDANLASRFGVLLSGNRVLDLTATGGKLPASLLQCIEQGDGALAAVRAAAADAEAALQRTGKAANVLALDAIRFEAPLRPPKIMAIGKNYADHVAEGSGKGYT